MPFGLGLLGDSGFPQHVQAWCHNDIVHICTDILWWVSLGIYWFGQSKSIMTLWRLYI